MKRVLMTIFLILLLTATVIPVKAQSDTISQLPNPTLHLPNYDSKVFHFGFLLAFNEMTLTLKTVKDYQSIAQPAASWPIGPFDYSNTQCLYVQNVEPMLRPGFTIGITSNLRLGRHFTLRLIPSMSFGERRIHYTIGIEDLNGDITTKDFTKFIKTTLLEFPLNIKYHVLRYNNISPYLFGGINPKIDLKTQKAPVENIPQLEFVDLVTKRFDCAGEFGIGLDLYAKKFKFGVEIKMSEGLLDIVKSKNLIYTAPIDRLHNRMFQFSFLFE